jgi:hypothetical protein
MSKTYRYTGEPDHYYPSLGIRPGAKRDGYDGVEFEFDENPDEYRFTEKAAAPKRDKPDDTSTTTPAAPDTTEE